MKKLAKLSAREVPEVEVGNGDKDLWWSNLLLVCHRHFGLSETKETTSEKFCIFGSEDQCSIGYEEIWKKTYLEQSECVSGGIQHDEQTNNFIFYCWCFGLDWRTVEQKARRVGEPRLRVWFLFGQFGDSRYGYPKHYRGAYWHRQLGIRNSWRVVASKELLNALHVVNDKAEQGMKLFEEDNQKRSSYYFNLLKPTGKLFLLKQPKRPQWPHCQTN